MSNASNIAQRVGREASDPVIKELARAIELLANDVDSISRTAANAEHAANNATQKVSQLEYAARR